MLRLRVDRCTAGMGVYFARPEPPLPRTNIEVGGAGGVDRQISRTRDGRFFRTYRLRASTENAFPLAPILNLRIFRIISIVCVPSGPCHLLGTEHRGLHTAPLQEQIPLPQRLIDGALDRGRGGIDRQGIHTRDVRLPVADFDWKCLSLRTGLEPTNLQNY